MGLFDNDEDLIREDCKNLGLTDEETEEVIECGISPEEWIEENDPDNYYDQDLDED